jgi:flagellar biosynthetic protein FlhB
MADEEKEDKTEQESQRRLRAAYEEGQVPLGRDLGVAASLAAGACALIIAGGKVLQELVGILSTSLQHLADKDPGAAAPRLGTLLILGALICGATALCSVAVTVAQTKGGVWPNLALPNLERLLEGQRIGRLFTREFLVDLGLSLLKVAVLGMVLWSSLKSEFLTLPALLDRSPGALLSALFAPLSRALGRVLVALFLIAGLDLALTRRRFHQRMTMTADEAKREYKEEEGDPLIRGRRRKRHRELAKGRAQTEVPKADALIVNPTHIAIAIRYRKSEGAAPRVLFKGKGAHAERMREIAREHGIPIVQDVPLARQLYKRVKVGRQVPAETYRAVAAVLAFVYRVTGRNPNAGVAA